MSFFKNKSGIKFFQPRGLERLLLLCFALIFCARLAESSYLPTVGSNIGIGTSTPVGGLVVMNGNVGIGTWSPTQRLQVVGTVAATTFTGDGSALTGLPASGGWTDGGTNVYTSATTDYIGIGTTTPTNPLTVVSNDVSQIRAGAASGNTNAQIVMDPLGTGVGVLKTGGAFDLTFQTNSAEKMRIQNSNGNVGIGTTAPLGPLHVSSANSANNLFLQTSHATSNANGIIFKARGANKWVISNDWSENGTQDFTIFDSVASSTRFFINSAGNIGIGTTTPAGALTVMNGNVGIGTWSLTGNSGALIVASGAGNVGIGTIRPGTALDVNGTVRSISGGFTFPDGTTQTSAASGGGWTDGGTNVYTSTTTDNVGIGTTTPASTLTLLGNIGIGTTLPYRTIAGPNNGMITEGNVGIGTWSAVNGKLIVMGGNVGIGTTKPTHALDVYGDGVVGIGGAITITHGAYTLINTSDSQLSLAINGTNLINLWSSNSVSILPNSTSTGLDVTQSGTGSAATFMGGNVGIGTTEPVGALTVMNGNVGIGTWSPISALEVKAPGSAQITINGASGGCLMFRDTDNAGWTECNALNGVLTCSLDADGVCDGS